MNAPVDTRDSWEVEAAVQTEYASMFPQADNCYIPTIFCWARSFFNGQHPGYQPVDLCYHDFEHTLQGVLCMARILRGRQLAGAEPALSQRMVELGLLAMLLHDTGYLKETIDREGTGAKYTAIHVQRSVEFAARFLWPKGFAPWEVLAVQNMIRCTGMMVDMRAIPFQWEEERIVGCALGSADYLGQMAARDYVDKLPVLYLEFEEAAHWNGNLSNTAARFANADDLMRKTPAFWEKFVQPKLNQDYGAVYRFLAVPYPESPNEYLERIEANIETLRQRFAAPAMTVPA